MLECEPLALSADSPVTVGDIVRFRWAGPTETCHLVQMILECDCPHYGKDPLHLHFVCTPVEPGTWTRLNTGQTYLGGYRYEGERLIGRQWPEGSGQFKTNGGELDELFLVRRKHVPVPEHVPITPAVKARPHNPNTTLTLEGW